MASGLKTSLTIVLTDEEYNKLISWKRSTKIAAGLAKRAQSVLLRAQGKSISDIARTLHMQRKHISKWLKRYRKDRIKGLYDKPRPGGSPVFSPRGGRVSGKNSL